jgi:hypothetical protein
MKPQERQPLPVEMSLAVPDQSPSTWQRVRRRSQRCLDRSTRHGRTRHDRCATPRLCWQPAPTLAVLALTCSRRRCEPGRPCFGADRRRLKTPTRSNSRLLATQASPAASVSAATTTSAGAASAATGSPSAASLADHSVALTTEPSAAWNSSSPESGFVIHSPSA